MRMLTLLDATTGGWRRARAAEAGGVEAASQSTRANKRAKIFFAVDRCQRVNIGRDESRARDSLLDEPERNQKASFFSNLFGQMAAIGSTVTSTTLLCLYSL